MKKALAMVEYKNQNAKIKHDIMITKKEFTFLSRNGKDNCHAITWTPDTKIKAVFQIVHGMREHVDRYDDFAKETFCHFSILTHSLL